MPILIPPLPPQVVQVRPLWETEEAQGPEGQRLREQMQLVIEHWGRCSSGAAEPDHHLLDDLNDYRHVPFEPAGSRRVRYVRITDLQPRSFVFDEDER